MTPRPTPLIREGLKSVACAEADQDHHRAARFRARCRTPTASSCWSNGRVAGLGTHDELLKTCDFYRDTYLAQNRASAEAEKDGAATEGTAAKGGEADAR